LRTYSKEFGIPKQRCNFSVSSSNFEEDIAPARTFTFMELIKRLKDQGLIKGGSFKNSIIFDGKGQPLNTILRFKNEIARHKLLDCIGDFALGGIIQGHYFGYKPGHSLNNKLLHSLFSNKANYKEIWKIS